MLCAENPEMRGESYNIHNLCSFKLINNLRFGGFLADRNFEYQYFRVNDVYEPGFVIRAGEFKPSTEVVASIDDKYFVKDGYLFLKDSYGKCAWDIQIKDFDGTQSEIDISASFRGFRKCIKYSAVKNIFVRSLISLHLILRKSALIHSSAVSFDDNAFLFVGRPGVFKTSIVMEFIRNYGAQYLGEENTIVRDGMAYPFPLNIKSFEYKQKYFDNENPSSKFQKLQLIKHVLCGRCFNNVPISKPCKIAGVFLLKKGDSFSIAKTELNGNMLADFLDNEKLEIGVTPTHMLSGVKENHFDEYINAYTAVVNESWLRNIWIELEKIIVDSYKNAGIFSVHVPVNFNNNICRELFAEIASG